MKLSIKSIAMSCIFVGFYQIISAMNPAQQFLKQHAVSKPHEVLGILPDASKDQINTAFRKLSLQWHPDKNLAFKEDAQEVFKKLSEAKEAMLSGKYSQESSNPQSAQNQSAAAAGFAPSAQASINDKKIKKMLDDIRILILTVEKKKDDINKALKAKLDLTDLIFTSGSNNPKTLAEIIIDFWNEFKMLVAYSIEIKQLGKVPGKQIVDLIKDYAQFLRVVGNNPDLNYSEKERKEIKTALDQAINRYEKVFGKIDLTLSAAQKEAIERAQGTFKMSIEEQVDPAVFKGTNRRMQEFFKQDLDKVLAKISSKQNPYAQIKDLISGFGDTIEGILSLAGSVKQQNKTMTHPQRYADWVKKQSTLIEKSLINEPGIQLKEDQRRELSAALKVHTDRFDTQFNK